MQPAEEKGGLDDFASSGNILEAKSIERFLRSSSQTSDNPAPKKSPSKPGQQSSKESISPGKQKREGGRRHSKPLAQIYSRISNSSHYAEQTANSVLEVRGSNRQTYLGMPLDSDATKPAPSSRNERSQLILGDAKP